MLSVCGDLSSSKNGGYFFLDSCFFVSTVRTSASDRRRVDKQLGREAYEKFGDLGTASGGLDGTATGGWRWMSEERGWSAGKSSRFRAGFLEKEDLSTRTRPAAGGSGQLVELLLNPWPGCVLRNPNEDSRLAGHRSWQPPISAGQNHSTPALIRPMPRWFDSEAAVSSGAE